jgi:hypothetical protein
MTTIIDAVRTICLGLPETEEVVSHGSPTYKAAGKSFAIYSLNHHGDDKVALLINLSVESQQMLVSSAPKIFFVPPYVGTKGWVGIELNKGLDWNRVAQLTLDGYCRSVSPGKAKVATLPVFLPPTIQMKPEDINPLKSKTNQAILKKLRSMALDLPETVEDSQFGNPCFKAGKKNFAVIFHHKDTTTLQIWVGAHRQLSMTSFDERFKIPSYVGHNGWINLNLDTKLNWQEIGELVEMSYRHFALKRILNALDSAEP